MFVGCWSPISAVWVLENILVGWDGTEIGELFAKNSFFLGISGCFDAFSGESLSAGGVRVELGLFLALTVIVGVGEGKCGCGCG